MNLIDALRQNNALTENGAVTHSTSLSACLDMFFVAGASRNMSEKDILALFNRACTENATLALKILFWARDCRGGAGERRFFKIIMSDLYRKYRDEDWFAKLSIYIPEYGTWKDFLGTQSSKDHDVLSYIDTSLEEHPNRNLLAKWFPRRGPWFVALHKHLGVSPKSLRRRLVDLTNVVETDMCSNKWEEIEYSKVPSVAMNKYRKAFFKHDEERMKQYITDVTSGNKKINASVLFPHQLYQAYMKDPNSPDLVKAITAQWDALPNYMEDTTERILPVCDVSSSMIGLPMDVSIALGVYISERNKGIFANSFITFNRTPTLEVLSGDLSQRLDQLSRANWGGNTNLQATFDLILSKALAHNIPETEMPTKLLIISDMEFDACEEGPWGRGDSPKTNLQSIREKYAEHGYTMPEIIFWNVNGRLGNVPASKEDDKVGLVSGFSPALLKSILKGQVYTPEQLMLDTVDVERYSRINLDS